MKISSIPSYLILSKLKLIKNYEKKHSLFFVLRLTNIDANYGNKLE